MKMEQFYKVLENVYLPCRENNILQLGFEPFKHVAKSPLDGIEIGSSSAGGGRMDNGSFTLYCKSDEFEGSPFSKTRKPAKEDPKKPIWVTDTEGTCQYFTTKKSDLEKHLYGKHKLKFLPTIFRCTHCASVSIDRVRAKGHMNVCPKILDWALKPNSTVTIHPQFLAEYTYWTDKKLVDFSRDKGDPVKTHSDVTRKQVLKDWFRMNTVSRTVNEVKTTASKSTSKRRARRGVSQTVLVSQPAPVLQSAPVVSDVVDAQVDEEMDIDLNLNYQILTILW